MGLGIFDSSGGVEGIRKETLKGCLTIVFNSGGSHNGIVKSFQIFPYTLTYSHEGGRVGGRSIYY